MKIDTHISMLFQLTDGNIAALQSALAMPMTEALDWLYLKRQKHENEIRFQASLHGAKLNGAASAAKPELSLRNFAMIAGARAMSHVEHVKVSREEMERRRIQQDSIKTI